MQKITNTHGRNEIFLFPKKNYHGMKNYAQLNIIIVVFIRIVIVFYKHNIFISLTPTKTRFQPYFALLFAFIAVSRK
jgi:hypothetical protein